MPFRFRKIIPLGKGFRLNLSKGGISSSVGVPGLTMNISKRGIRPTVSAPGTGLSFTPSTSRKKGSSNTTNCLIAGISLLLICIISICCLGVIFFSDPLSLSTPTPFVLDPIGTIVEGTSRAEQMQTLAVSTLIAPPPSFTPVQLPPTVIQPVTIFPATLAPTWTPIPTFTPFVLNTQPIVSAPAVCSCSEDLYNCVLTDFQTQRQAQACFDYCISQGRGDIHRLDGNDNDGRACESLP